MREIKFRMWSKEYRRMFGMTYLEAMYSVGARLAKQHVPGVAESEVAMPETGISLPFQDDAVLMQYSGLPDKSGKEIYEGDIWKASENGIDSIGVVEYYGCSFRVRYNFVSELLGRAVRYGEVIGNIYEHPHLLEEQNHEHE